MGGQGIADLLRLVSAHLFWNLPVLGEFFGCLCLGYEVALKLGVADTDEGLDDLLV